MKTHCPTPIQSPKHTSPRSVGAPEFAPWPYFDEDEIEVAANVLRSGKVNYWTGEEGRHFESEFAEFTGCKHAVALANGTVALEAALKAIGVGPGDEVVTPSRTFIASASCAAVLGARPVMVDVNRDSQNASADTIRARITPKTKAIIAVHLAGWPCDMDPIMDLAREHNLYVVEDCAQAHGAEYKKRPVGSLGHVAAFSFCQDKNMTTAGEGGMLTTNDSGIWERAWSYKDHGKSYHAVCQDQHVPGFRWLHESFGTNWRMTEVQSAIGRIALKKLPGWIEMRRHHASTFAQSFSRIPGLRVPRPSPDFGHSYYKYYTFVRREDLCPSWNRDRIVQAIVAEGVPCFVGSCSEIYLERAFKNEGRSHERLPVARELGETSLMFLVHPTLSEEAIQYASQVVERVMEKATSLSLARPLSKSACVDERLLIPRCQT
jgi:dTDP-4-amino-4,6-dideoxygalactose transaminase